MQIEIRANNELRITGYVNVTEKLSRPLLTPYGKLREIIREGSFKRAIERAKNVILTVDHGEGVYASTETRTLELKEDSIGLYADVIIKDKKLIDHARKGEIRGWSFGMFDIVDELEERANEKIRVVKELVLDHITLVVNKLPCYASTSVEVRADKEVDVEVRSFSNDIKLVETPAKSKEAKEEDLNKEYFERIKNLKKV